MSELKLVTLDNAHLEIPKYITENNLTIETYENMMDVVLSMIRDRFFFNMDKNILRGCLEDLTYMYSSEDDVNKAVDKIVSEVKRLRALSPLWEMAQDGVDLTKINWAAH